MTQQKSQLHKTLWDIANTLRGNMGADEFRDYILGFIFYKYLSEKTLVYANSLISPIKFIIQITYTLVVEVVIFHFLILSHIKNSKTELGMKMELLATGLGYKK